MPKRTHEAIESMEDLDATVKLEWEIARDFQHQMMEQWIEVSNHMNLLKNIYRGSRLHGFNMGQGGDALAHEMWLDDEAARKRGIPLPEDRGFRPIGEEGQVLFYFQGGYRTPLEIERMGF